MTLLQCDNVSFGYQGGTLFRDVSFTLDAGERVAIVAPNGQGKSTLLRLLAGQIEPDEGRVIVPRGARIGYLRQSHELDAVGTVADALLAPFGEVVAARHELHDAMHGAADEGAAALDRLSSAQDAYHRVGGDELERRVVMLAGTVGFSEADMERPVSSLSGGERGRLVLGCVLASDPQVLLLDEPTSHLDVETTERLEQLLVAFKGAAVIVSHDRAFLDATAPITLELGSRVARLFHASYTGYVEEREEVMQRENARFERQREQITRTEDFIRRNIAGQKTKQAQSRRKQLDKLDREERFEDVWAGAGRIAIRFADAPRSGDIVLDAKRMRAERGGRLLFDRVDLLLRRGERVGVVGPNGSGKTTLLKLLAGRGEPEDRGDVRLGSNVVPGYFDQNLEVVSGELSAVDEIRAQRGEMVVDAVRQYLARFRLFGDDVFRKVSSLSGGERTRLALAKMLLVPRNLLLFDEPTNHLDIPATEILEEALGKFDGAAVLVSHDRYFLDRVCTRIVHLDGNGGVTFYPGSYFAFRGSQEAAPEPERPPQRMAAPAPAPSSPPPKPVGRDVHEEQRRRQRETERRSRRIDELEKQIAQTEDETNRLREKLAGLSGGEWDRMMRMAEQERALTQKLERLLAEWTALSEEAAHG